MLRKCEVSDGSRRLTHPDPECPVHGKDCPGDSGSEPFPGYVDLYSLPPTGDMVPHEHREDNGQNALCTSCGALDHAIDWHWRKARGMEGAKE